MTVAESSDDPSPLPAPPTAGAAPAHVPLAALGTARERMLLAVLAAAQFTNLVDFMVVMPLGPEFMRTLEITPAQFGFMVSAYAFAAGVAGLAASAVIDRFARKAAFIWLYSGFMLGTLLCGLAPNYVTLVAARIVTGAFGGVLGGLLMAVIGDVFPEERRGRATAVLMSAFALATVLGVPLGLELGVRGGWHAPFLALAALGAPVLVLAARAMPTLKPYPRAAGAPGPLATMIEALTFPTHVKAFALITTLMCGSFAVIPYVSTYLVQNVGVNEKDELPWVFVASGACVLCTAPLAGRLADRYGRIWVYRGFAPISAALMLVITQLPRVGLAIAVATVAGLMVANSSRMVAAMALVNDSVEPRRRGGFMSANSSMQHIASGLGAYLGGQILGEVEDGSGGSMLTHYGYVGVIGALATLISIWLAGRLRPLGPAHAITLAESIGAAAEATTDSGELRLP